MIMKNEIIRTQKGPSSKAAFPIGRITGHLHVRNFKATDQKVNSCGAISSFYQWVRSQWGFSGIARVRFGTSFRHPPHPVLLSNR